MTDGCREAASGGGMLSQMERETLEKSRVELAPTARQESYIQKFYLYQNLTKPSEKLYLSYCKATSDGSAMRSSYVIRMVMRLFPEIQVQDEDYTENLLKRAVTTRSGITLLAEGLQNIRETSPSAAWMELYQWYRKQENWQEQTEDLVHAAFLRFDESGIGKAAASKLYGGDSKQQRQPSGKVCVLRFCSFSAVWSAVKGAAGI